MSDEINAIVREVRRFPWAKADWLPELQVIDYQVLEEERPKFEKALAGFEAATAKGKGVAEAVEKLASTVESVIRNIADTFGSEESYGWRASFNEIRLELERHNVTLRHVPVSAGSFAEWEAEEDQDPEVVALGRRRLEFDDDMRALRQFEVVSLKDSILRDGRIVAAPVAQATAAREALAPA